MDDILLTNDDGYRSIGFYPLLKELKKEFSVAAVAPESGKSWIGKAISARTPLKIKQADLNGTKIHTCSGTPADCTQIALYNILKEKPKMVVSGINIGENISYGQILSSGTVGAAMEAAIDGIKAVSASLYFPPNTRTDIDFFDSKNYHIYNDAAKITAKIVSILMKQDFEEKTDLISVNIPYGATIDTEFEITRPAKIPIGKLFHKKDEDYIHSYPFLDFKDPQEGTDMKAIYENKIAITPINLDLVAEESIGKLKEIISKDW